MSSSTTVHTRTDSEHVLRSHSLLQHMWATYYAKAPAVVLSAFATSTVTILFTVPQVVLLSQKSSHPLPRLTFSHLASLYTKAIAPQTAIKVIHFSFCRWIKQLLDALPATPISPAAPLGPFSINAAYGITAVPMQALAYNLLTATTMRHFGAAPPPEAASPWARVQRLYQRSIKPGMLWTMCRDANSIGGGLLLGGAFSQHLQRYVDAAAIAGTLPAALHPYCCSLGGTSGTGLASEEANRRAKPQPRRLMKFVGGLGGGIVTACGTHWLHNAALTAARSAAVNEPIGNFAALRRLFQQHGVAACYRGLGNRIVVISGMTAVMTMLEPLT
eukprot:TRINITY_DN15474_c0_g1_i1.p1 TRINITY_DN15474_c0_g1~~TRINITY_DN15474_c0_g1_i1.p1  ORF type:complete len:331 (+),score=40.31 TRINITY_DN15474_c0_g1_i1:106-1098(+)